MAKSTSSLASSSSSASTCSGGSLNSSPSRPLNALKTSSAIDRRKRLAANARERKRMHLLNKAYDQLRRRLVDAENKSKYDVLVQAKEYIQALATICETFDQQHPEFAKSQTYLIDSNRTQNSPVDMTFNQPFSISSSSDSSDSTLLTQQVHLL